MPKRLGHLLVIALLTAVILGADARDARFSRVGHQMMCVCSCGQVLLECNHVGCPDSDRMIGELRTQLASGADDKTVLDWFVEKYGATVLAAPIRGGFDSVAWIAPLALFLTATVGTTFVVRSWVHRRQPNTTVEANWALPSDESAHRTRIRRETEF